MTRWASPNGLRRTSAGGGEPAPAAAAERDLDPHPRAPVPGGKVHRLGDPRLAAPARRQRSRADRRRRAWIDEPLLPEPVRLPAGRRQARVRIEVTFGRRGRRRLPPPALVLRDPFGLAQRVIAGPSTDEILVLPKLYPVNLTASGGDATPAHARASLLAAAETEIDGLRPWREGSPALRIHWQSFARGAGLMERKLISEADSRPLVVMDPRAASSPDALDSAVRAACSLAVYFARKTGCSLLLPGDRRAAVIEHDLLAWPALHVRMALIGRPRRPVAGRRPEPPRPRDLCRRAPGRPRPARARPHAGRMPRRPSRAKIGGRRAILEVAGCFGYAAGRHSGAAAVAALEGAA